MMGIKYKDFIKIYFCLSLCGHELPAMSECFLVLSLNDQILADDIRKLRDKLA
jgi:hypothetical protein